VQKGWKTFGWCGMTFMIPERWAPGRIEGDEREGSLRIDDPLMERINLRWKLTSAGKIGLFIDKHIHEIKRQARKKGIDLVVKRRLDYPLGKRFHGEFFHWKADLQAYNLCFQTGGKTNRVIFLRILGKLDEDIHAQAKKIASSFRVSVDSRPKRWALFGLDVTIPGDFKMEGYSLLAGSVKITFSRRGQELTVNKFSLARTVLREESLKDWVLRHFKGELKNFGCDIKEREIHGHPGLMVAGERKGLLTRKFWKRKALLYCWFCQDSNKLLVILNKFQREDEIEEVARGVLCH